MGTRPGGARDPARCRRHVAFASTYVASASRSARADTLRPVGSAHARTNPHSARICGAAVTMTTRAVSDVSAVDRARTLLENLRRTPMVRGGHMLERRRLLKAQIAPATLDQGVPERLPARIPFQRGFKFSPPQWGAGPPGRALA